MIITHSDGSKMEISGKEYLHWVAMIMVHYTSENRFEPKIMHDARIDAAKLLLKAIAEQAISGELKDSYLKTAHELIEAYNRDMQGRSIGDLNL